MASVETEGCIPAPASDVKHPGITNNKSNQSDFVNDADAFSCSHVDDEAGGTSEPFHMVLWHRRNPGLNLQFCFTFVTTILCKKFVKALGFWSVLVVPVSAGLYLFDFVTNILVLKEYWRLYKSDFFGHNYSNLGGRDGLVPFAACLAFMVVQHILNAVAFMVKLPPEEHPFRSAFFLPIVQFRRFVGSIFKTGSCAYSGYTTSESLETEALYAVMSAIETGPQLVIQFTVSFALAGSQNPGSDWRDDPIIINNVLKISVVASFLSISYNTGRAVMFQMSKRWTFTLSTSGIAGAVYTFSPLLLRCTTVTSIVLFIDRGEISNSNEFGKLLLATYYGVGVLPISYMNGLLSVSLKSANMWSWASQLEVMVAAYISTVIGPLYSVVEGYSSFPKDRKHHSKCTLPAYLAVATGINFLPDVVFLTLLALRKSTTCNFKAYEPKSQGSYENYSLFFPPKDLSTTFTCLQFEIYIGLGTALGILSCTILVCLSSVYPNAQCQLDEMAIEEPENLTGGPCSFDRD